MSIPEVCPFKGNELPKGLYNPKRVKATGLPTVRQTTVGGQSLSHGAEINVAGTGYPSTKPEFTKPPTVKQI